MSNNRGQDHTGGQWRQLTMQPDSTSANQDDNPTDPTLPGKSDQMSPGSAADSIVQTSEEDNISGGWTICDDG